MRTIKFKTNINCGGCKATVKPFLDKLVGADAWEVDTDNRDKILTISDDKIDSSLVLETIVEAGYKGSVL